MIDLFISEKVKKLKESIHHFENRIQNIKLLLIFITNNNKSIVYKLKTFSISKILYSYFRKKWNKLLFFVF